MQILAMPRQELRYRFGPTTTNEGIDHMGELKTVDFGTTAERHRAKLADSLEEIAGHIRRGELEFDPQGFILMLQSDQHPAMWEVLNLGIPTTIDMERAAIAIRTRTHKRL
jgi:hypothetical protein